MATGQTQAPAAAGLDRDEATELYRRMRLIRRFEETVQALRSTARRISTSARRPSPRASARR